NEESDNTKERTAFWMEQRRERLKEMKAAKETGRTAKGIF
ncbi:hypothetical protein A2U01_0065496, partial [Trifolium medium]|nr:hypothetical protein [Trifolium medium]